VHRHSQNAHSHKVKALAESQTFNSNRFVYPSNQPVSNSMTKLAYLDNTYQFTADATIVDITQSERGTSLILDSTIFHPQGGGQPADIGVIRCSDKTFNVTDCRLTENGNVHHFGEFESESMKVGDNVALQIDSDRRQLHARLHSAGHLLDIAVRKCGIPDLVPTKGYHFAAGSNVEYDGTLPNAAEWILPLQQACEALIAENVSVVAETLNPGDAMERGIWAPPGKPARVIEFTNYLQDSCGCGGTHVSTSGEIGQITVRKIKSKKGVTKISYAL
jgi:Ser-tRNA(Ala) deacylase AlaX